MNDFDVAYSMLRREAESLVFGMTGIDVRSHPLAKMAFDGALKKYDPHIRGFIGLVVSDPPNSVDAATSVLKEEAESKLDAFSEKFKAKLAEQQNKQEEH